MPALQEKKKTQIRSSIANRRSLSISSAVKEKELKIRTRSRTYTITRLTEAQYENLAKDSVFQPRHRGLLTELEWSDAGIYPDLSKMFAILMDLFGESGDLGGRKDCAFFFPFLVRSHDGTRDSDYLMNLQTVRTTLEFQFSRVSDPDHGIQEGQTSTDAMGDFSEPETRLFLRAFLNRLTIQFGKRRERILALPRFGTVESNLVLFGWCSDHEFMIEFKEESEYRRTVSCLEEVWG